MGSENQTRMSLNFYFICLFVDRHDNVLAVHFCLAFSPNVLLFSGFILWGSAGGKLLYLDCVLLANLHTRNLILVGLTL